MFFGHLSKMSNILLNEPLNPHVKVMYVLNLRHVLQKLAYLPNESFIDELPQKGIQ